MMTGMIAAIGIRYATHAPDTVASANPLSRCACGVAGSSLHNFPEGLVVYNSVLTGRRPVHAP